MFSFYAFIELSHSRIMLPSRLSALGEYPSSLDSSFLFSSFNDLFSLGAKGRL
jgi:hypothetical protein